jgi:plastocyanin
MRTRLPLLVLAASFALSGCELIVRFDPARLDAAADGMTADRVTTDTPPPSDIVDVTMDAADVVDATEMDAGDVADAEDVSTVDAPDVVEADAVDVIDVVDVPGVDAADVVDVPLVDVVDVVDAGADEGPDTIEDAGDDALDGGEDAADAGDDTADASIDDAGDDVDDAATDTGPSFFALNGCAYASAMDLTADAMPTITFPGATFMYTPSCIRIHAGQTVTFTADSGSDFSFHPLMPGDGATRTTQPGTPITPTATGTTVTFTFPDPGTWGFYCQIHAPSMAGAIYVDP